MKLVTQKQKITQVELADMSQKMLDILVKAVIDLEQEIMIVDAFMHSDQEAVLLEQGSQQENLWGINIRPDRTDESWIEFDSMINIRPNQGNRSRGIQSDVIQKKIRSIVERLVIR